MSTPLQYYRDLPPVAKTYAVICLMTTTAYHMGLYNIHNLALFYSEVFKKFQLWRLITNFFFLGSFSIPFGLRIITILHYGVSLERGAFDKRTADYLWMFIFGALSLLVMAAVPFLWSPFQGPALVFMIVYVWARENPTVRVSIQGLVEIKGFYLPWMLLGVDTIMGYPWMPGLQGIAAGHIFYFLTVLYPLSTGKNYCNTPIWVHKLVAFWGEGFQQNAPVRQNDYASGTVFHGRSRRLNESRRNWFSTGSQGSRTSSSSQQREEDHETNTAYQTAPASQGVAFRGKSNRLGSN